MSYEGFSQNLCNRGHLSLVDCNDHLLICPVCCSPFVWSNEVDETNGDAQGMVDLEPYLKRASRVINKETSDGWVTIHRHAEYKIPPTVISPPRDSWLDEPPDEEFIKASTEKATEQF